MYSVVVNENVLHLEVGLLAVFLVLELNEGVLQAVSRLLIPDDFAG